MTNTNSYCSPVKNKNTNTNGCFDDNALIKIATNLNKKGGNININLSNPKELWNQINNQINNHIKDKKCQNGEICWTTSDIIDKSLIDLYYKPLKPDGKYKWLKTSDINKVLAQFELLYDNFIFMGAIPIDFDIVSKEYANIDICKLKNNGITKIGCVFNLDKHNQKGSHWVSLFIDLNIKYIGYFDSVGVCPPPLEVIKLMNKICIQADKCAKIKLTQKCNKVRHQYGNSECGVYSLYFIYQCLLGKTFEEVANVPISDEKVNLYRDYFFRPL